MRRRPTVSTRTDPLLPYTTLFLSQACNAEFSVGQFNNFQSLEELTSSLHTSFIERAAFTDAFGFERRLGAAAQFKGKRVLVQAGLFTDNVNDQPNQNWGADARVVLTPYVGSARLHLGASAHHADFEAGSKVRHRQRPARENK